MASAVLDPRRWWALALVLLVYAVGEAGFRPAAPAGLALMAAGSLVLPGRPRKPAHELPEPDPAADAAAAGDVAIRSGTK